MQRCRELSKLPKAAKPRSVNFRRTTPGSLTPFFNTDVEAFCGPLDPSHPASRLRQPVLYRTVPTAHANGFILRAVPKAVLHRVPYPWPDPPFRPASERGPDACRINMSLLKVLGKNVSRSAVVRKRIGYRVKTALGLIVSRGADVELDTKGRERVVFKQEDAGQKWVLQDWTYYMLPTLELYRMPIQTLIPSLRRALITVNQRARQLDERGWQRVASPDGKAKKLDRLAEQS